MTQPIGTRPALTPVPTAADSHRDRSLRRLLAAWLRITAKLISVQAHDGVGEADLIEAVTRVEDVLRARHVRAWQAMQATLLPALAAAEADHTGEWPGSCPACQRLRDGLPITVADLVAAGGRRLTGIPAQRSRSVPGEAETRDVCTKCEQPMPAAPAASDDA